MTMSRKRAIVAWTYNALRGRVISAALLMKSVAASSLSRPEIKALAEELEPMLSQLAELMKRRNDQ